MIGFVSLEIKDIILTPTADGYGIGRIGKIEADFPILQSKRKIPLG